MAFPVGWTLVGVSNSKSIGLAGDVALFHFYLNEDQIPQKVFDTCHSTGGDIRITKINNPSSVSDLLNLEIKQITAGTPTAEFYVKSDLDKDGGDTIYWWTTGGSETQPGYPNDGNSLEVFGNTTGISVTYHMTKNVTITESSVYGYNGTDVATSDIAGYIGQARDFNGSTSEVTKSSAAGLVPSTSENLIISFWAKAGSLSDYDVLVHKGNTDWTSGGWGVYYLNNAIHFWINSYLGADVISVALTSTDTDWHLFQCVIDMVSGTSGIYMMKDYNAATAQDTSTADMTDGGDNLVMGQDETDLYSFDGILDEVRVRISTLEGGPQNLWRYTEWKNLSDPDSLWEIGTLPSSNNLRGNLKSNLLGGFQ